MGLPTNRLELDAEACRSEESTMNKQVKFEEAVRKISDKTTKNVGRPIMQRLRNSMHSLQICN